MTLISPPPPPPPTTRTNTYLQSDESEVIAVPFTVISPPTIFAMNLVWEHGSHYIPGRFLKPKWSHGRWADKL